VKALTKHEELPAFTLIELLVVIAIIAILGCDTSSVPASSSRQSEGDCLS
jgi:prepilin-type N-terminal cleavage/methylation domain-containing protein